MEVTYQSKIPSLSKSPTQLPMPAVSRLVPDAAVTSWNIPPPMFSNYSEVTKSATSSRSRSRSPSMSTSSGA